MNTAIAIVIIMMHLISAGAVVFEDGSWVGADSTRSGCITNMACDDFSYDAEVEAQVMTYVTFDCEEID